ncbi:MAG: serine/threonine protein kinase, partial [Pyrinomonadaceae bacterium]|nr:serine/threonine protein kinase [Pyrinomonadaceae bacterium]
DVLLGNAFEREARTLARLRHPVLPKVSDHFTDEGTQYLVMEHISGEDMSKRLEAAPKPFPLSWVLFWADQLLDALTYLHTHEPPIIHRDIKPQNLKLTDENHIVLLDFGLSKNSAGETRSITTGSGGGSIVGYTPHYAPMEQIRGTGTDARSDIYSLSATLYQILTGGIPPDALTRADSLINGLPDPIKPINEINTEVSRGVSDVIVKGMAISQEQRYKTAREMQKALRDAYAQMQNEPAANTAAVKHSVVEPAISQTQQKTEIMPSGSLISQATPTMPTASDSAVSKSPSLPPSGDNGKSVPDFEATLRYDPEYEESIPKQADIRTEVFLAGSSSVIAEAQQGKFSREESFKEESFKEESFKEESFVPEKPAESENLEESRFFSEEDLNQSPGYSPDATVPLMSLGNLTDENGSNATAVNFDSFAKEENKTSTFTPAGTSIPSEQVKPPAKQKSNKTLAIGGGLAALLILAISAGAIGWFVMRDNGSTSDNTTPMPTSEATATVEPTVEPTLEVVNDVNTNTNTNEPTNSEVLTTNTNDSANIKTVKTPTTTATAVPTKTVQPQPTRTAAATPRSTPLIDRPPPTPRPTVKKTPPPIVQ